jgi:hypothetical protein
MTDAALRHYCRNQRCRSKLKEPTDSLPNAFWTRGCLTSFYRTRCLVCERPTDGPLPDGSARSARTERRRLCGRRQCAADFRRDRAHFLGRWHIPSDSTNALKTSVKPASFWRVVAGPPLSPVSLRLATLPLSPHLAAEQDRQQQQYEDHHRKLRRAARRAARLAEAQAAIQRHHPPVNILGGYKWPDAPIIDLELPFVPSPPGGDPWDIPAFLRRERV